MFTGEKINFTEVLNVKLISAVLHVLPLELLFKRPRAFTHVTLTVKTKLCYNCTS